MIADAAGPQNPFTPRTSINTTQHRPDRKNLDLDAGTVRVEETVYELGTVVKGKPKSEAGRRTVVLPDLIIPDLRKPPTASCSSACGVAGSGEATSPRPGRRL